MSPAQRGAVRPAPVELPRKIAGTKTSAEMLRQRMRDEESPRSRPRRGRRPNRTVIGVVVVASVMSAPRAVGEWLLQGRLLDGGARATAGGRDPGWVGSDVAGLHGDGLASEGDPG